jgi:transposase
LEREGEALGVFLDVQGVEATHNIAARAYRFGVLWRKRSQGTCSKSDTGKEIGGWCCRKLPQECPMGQKQTA